MEIRELRIGNHVLCMGERHKVTRLSDMDLVDIDGTVVTTENIDPIPITEELLKELGFEEDKAPEDGWNYGIEKVFSKEHDAPIECEDPYISLAQYEGGLYQLQIMGTIAYVRNLHELESFVFMTTKEELI